MLGRSSHKCSLHKCQGYKQPLEAEDIFGLAPDDKVESVAKDFRAQWQQELQKPNGPSLVRRLLCLLLPMGAPSMRKGRSSPILPYTDIGSGGGLLQAQSGFNMYH